MAFNFSKRIFQPDGDAGLRLVTDQMEPFVLEEPHFAGDELSVHYGSTDLTDQTGHEANLDLPTDPLAKLTEAIRLGSRIKNDPALRAYFEVKFEGTDRSKWGDLGGVLHLAADEYDRLQNAPNVSAFDNTKSQDPPLDCSGQEALLLKAETARLPGLDQLRKEAEQPVVRTVEDLPQVEISPAEARRLELVRQAELAQAKLDKIEAQAAVQLNDEKQLKRVEELYNAVEEQKELRAQAAIKEAERLQALEIARQRAIEEVERQRAEKRAHQEAMALAFRQATDAQRMLLITEEKNAQDEYAKRSVHAMQIEAADAAIVDVLAAKEQLILRQKIELIELKELSTTCLMNARKEVTAAAELLESVDYDSVQSELAPQPDSENDQATPVVAEIAPITVAGIASTPTVSKNTSHVYLVDPTTGTKITRKTL